MTTLNIISRSTAEEIQIAGMGKRFIAFLFDYIPTSAYILLLLAIGAAITMVAGPLDQKSLLLASPVLWDATAFLVLVLPVILYFSLQENSPHQATWGKRKVGIKVINSRVEQLTRRQAFLRSLSKFLPWPIAHTSIFHIDGWPFSPTTPTPLVTAGFVMVWILVAVYGLSALFTKGHRTLYDWAADSHVILSRG